MPLARPARTYPPASRIGDNQAVFRTFREGYGMRPSSTDPRFQRAAGRTVRSVIAAGVVAYDRDRDLPRLIRATAFELADPSPPTRRALLARLARALRAERNRGRAGHWTYDLNRHIALRQAYEAEKGLNAARFPRR